MNQMLFGRGTFNYGSDATGALLSATAAITTPVRAAHQLAAGSTVVGASKTSLDAEFYANATAGTLQMAIAKSYSAEMDAFLRQLGTVPRLASVADKSLQDMRRWIEDYRMLEMRSEESFE